MFKCITEHVGENLDNWRPKGQKEPRLNQESNRKMIFFG